MSEKNIVLVTGANGFVGRRLCEILAGRGIRVRGTVRAGGIMLPDCETFISGEMHADTCWDRGMRGVSTVIHCAGRTHVTRERATDPLAEYRRVNVEATRSLCLQAAQAGAGNFVFISSVKVNGESTGEQEADAFKESDRPSPQDAYALSKLEAEQTVRDIGREQGMRTVIVRPPLVYGPGVKANFLSLITLVRSGAPLPFKNVQNLRDFIFLDNLCDALIHCALDARAAGRTFLLSDGKALSTPALIRKLAHAMGRKSLLFPFPWRLLRACARVSGCAAGRLDKMIGSLRVDISLIQTMLGWEPPVSIDEGLKKTVGTYEKGF